MKSYIDVPKKAKQPTLLLLCQEGLLHMQTNTELETQSVRENCNCKENLLVGESLLFNLRSVRLIIDQGCHYPRQSSTTVEAMSCFAVVKGGWHTYDTA